MGRQRLAGAGNIYDASKYEKLTFDILINNAASSNTPIPITLWGHDYENSFLTNLPITLSGWQHIEIPIPSTINLPNCTAYGAYFWYNTTASTPPAHVEYRMDNVKFVGRNIPIPPPTMSITPVTQRGLLFDSGPGEGGQRGAIDTLMDVRWTVGSTPASPTTYAMTINWAPNPVIYSNYEAHIWLAPHSGVGNPDWNEPDMGYLQILSRNDGTAIARMMWKTNDALDNTMLFNEQPGGQYGTNGYAAGTLGYLVAPSMTGTWSINFTSDTDLIVSGPGGVSTNFSLPADWVTSFNAVLDGSVYAYFGAGPNGANNAGQPLYLSQVDVTAAATGWAFTNLLTTQPYDTNYWGRLGTETVQVLPESTWWLKWTLPATDFNLWANDSLSGNTPWVLLSGNTALPVPVSTYAWGTNMKALVASADLPSTTQTYFAMRKLVAAKLQVLLPGETNAPYTVTGKVGTPDPQTAGVPFDVRVNAVDADWHIATGCTDTVNLTSTDTAAVLPADAALAAGTGTFSVTLQTAGSWTITASDVTTNTVTAGTSSPITIP